MTRRLVKAVFIGIVLYLLGTKTGIVIAGFVLTFFVHDHFHQITAIDKYAYKSPLHKIPGISKLLFFLTVLIICVSQSDPVLFIFVILSMAIITVFVGKVPLRIYLSALFIPISFVLAGMLVFRYDLSFSPLSLSIDEAGTQFGWLLTARVFAAISCLYALIFSTPLSVLIETLQKMRIPALIIEFMTLMLKFVYIFSTMYEKMRQASRSRCGNSTFKNGIRSTGLIWSQLMRRSLEQARSSYDGMLARGYNGKLTFLTRPVKHRIWHLLFAVLYLTVIGLRLGGVLAWI
ncbi:MAG TPA: cobalt ECF transporter T component CbiQ [Clostridiaceae bacterium]|nr:cobalt ECF transporter T component CbiQ [Clostridiaceae bacterium]